MAKRKKKKAAPKRKARKTAKRKPRKTAKRKAKAPKRKKKQAKRRRKNPSRTPKIRMIEPMTVLGVNPGRIRRRRSRNLPPPGKVGMTLPLPRGRGRNPKGFTGKSKMYKNYISREMLKDWKRKIDPRSIRTKTIKTKKGGKRLLRFGCPKGQWMSRKKRCKTGMKAISMLYPREELIKEQKAKRRKRVGRERTAKKRRARVANPRLTVAQARKLMPPGFVLSKKDAAGEYRVGRRGAPDSKRYYTPDLRDALDTAIDMYRRGDNPGRRQRTLPEDVRAVVESFPDWTPAQRRNLDQITWDVIQELSDNEGSPFAKRFVEVYVMPELRKRRPGMNPPRRRRPALRGPDNETFTDWFIENKDSDEAAEQYANYRLECRQMGFAPLTFRKFMKQTWEERVAG